MSLSNWQCIKDQTVMLEKLALEGDWVQFSEQVTKLDQSLHSFFKAQITALTTEQQSQIKQEGNQIVTTIYTLLEKAKQEKKKINSEAGKMAQGKKGISAYKKI